MEIKSSLLPTSVTYSGESLSSSAKIPTFFENSKIEEDYSESDGLIRPMGLILRLCAGRQGLEILSSVMARISQVSQSQ